MRPAKERAYYGPLFRSKATVAGMTCCQTARLQASIPTMANWCNLRLVVTGHARDLAPFRRAAGALRGHIDTSRSTVFTGDMEYGEGGDLEADGLTRFDGDLRRAKYRFQGRNDDYVDFFREMSRR